MTAPRVMLADRRAAHQIVLSSSKPGCGAGIAVSCTCRRVPRAGRSGFTPIKTRKLFPAAEAIAAWRAWHESREITIA